VWRARHEISQSIGSDAVAHAGDESLPERAVGSAKKDGGAHRIAEPSRAGKYSEAIPPAQRQVANAEGRQRRPAGGQVSG